MRHAPSISPPGKGMETAATQATDQLRAEFTEKGPDKPLTLLHSIDFQYVVSC